MEDRKILRDLEAVNNMNNAVKKALGCYKSEKVALSIRNLYVNVTRFTKEFDSRFFGVDLDSDQWIQGVIGVSNKVCIAITDYLGDSMSKDKAKEIYAATEELVSTVSENYDFCNSAERLRESAKQLYELISDPSKVNESVNAWVTVNQSTSLDEIERIINQLAIKQVKFTPDSENYADFEAKIRGATEQELEINKLLCLLEGIRWSVRDYFRIMRKSNNSIDIRQYVNTLILTIIKLRDSMCDGVIDESDISAMQKVWDLLIDRLKVDGCKENLVLIDEWHNLANELDMSSIKTASANTESLLYSIRWNISENEEVIEHGYESNPIISVSETLRQQMMSKYKDIFKGQMVDIINLSTHRDAEDCLAIASHHFGIWWEARQPISIDTVSTYKSVDLDLVYDYVDWSENKTFIFVDSLDAVLPVKRAKFNKGSLIVDMSGRILSTDDPNFNEILNGGPNTVNITDVIFGKPIEQRYCRVFSKFLGITEEQCIEILDKSGYKLDTNASRSSFRQSESENYAIEGNPKGVLDFLTVADELGYVKTENITDIKMRVKHSNQKKPDDYELKFIQGSRLSELGCNVVHAVNEKFIIGSDWDGAMTFGSTPYTIMKLTGPLVLDENKEFSYCRPVNFSFKDIDWKDTIHLKDGDVLKIEGNVTISANCPIDATGSVTIEGIGENAQLSLCNYDTMQPCIGSKTHTGLSYGRWQVSSYKCVSVTLSNIKVECDSVNENFTVGEYGTDRIPEIYLTNGAELIAPEINHDRVMTVGPAYESGSTKLSAGVEYELFELNSQEVGHCQPLVVRSVGDRVAAMQEEMRRVLGR